MTDLLTKLAALTQNGTRALMHSHDTTATNLSESCAGMNYSAEISLELADVVLWYVRAVEKTRAMASIHVAPSATRRTCSKRAEKSCCRVGERRRAASWRLDASARIYRCRAAGSSIPASLLDRRAGEVLSRTLIAEAVWDTNFDRDTNVVNVNVRRLRSKADDRFPLKLIRTVRGAGYVLEAGQ